MTAISAALKWNDDKAYFFEGNRYLRYDIGDDRADAGYPLSIAGRWPGLWESNIDAAINWGNGKVYFFRGNEYLRYDIARDETDQGYPLSIAGRWPGLWESNIDAAINWGNGKVYFFRGNEYLRYDIARDETDQGYPLSIAGRWPGLWESNIDAAINWGNGKAYFFQGGEYIRYDIAADRVDLGPRPTVKHWPGFFLFNFTFDDDITGENLRTLHDRHIFAFSRILACGNLSDPQKEDLLNAYTRVIRHSSLTTPGVNGQAIIGGSQLWINFGVLFPQGANEIAQTLIHEMMHCAGYTHPVRQSTDSPGDGGPYYGTPPLQAEICIAGVQSDRPCIDENGRCTIR